MTSCSYCNKSFANAKKLSDHRTSCSQMPESLRTCDTCQSTFSTISKLRYHRCVSSPSMPSTPSSSSQGPVAMPSTPTTPMTPTSSSTPRTPLMSPSGGPSRITEGINSARSNASLLDAIAGSSQMNESTKKKDRWVCQLIENFCAEMPEILKQNHATAHLAEDEAILDVYGDPDTLRFFLLFLSNHDKSQTVSFQVRR